MEYIEKRLINSRKEIPKNHKIEARYQSYERAKDYIKHISRVFDNTLQKSAEYDSSCIESLNFKSKLPQLGGKYKISSFPTSQLSQELSSKIALINAYNHLADLPLSNSKTKYKTTSLSPIKKHRRIGLRKLLINVGC